MMVLIHHRLTTASKPAAKHAKPSSLKYADTTKRKTDLKKYITHTHYIGNAQEGLGRDSSRNWGMVHMGVDCKTFLSGHKARVKLGQ